MATFDAIFVGSGINSLVGAALLARDGWSVCVLERNDVAGGCIRTSRDLTLPGFTHEVLASWHPLFTGSAAYAELKDALDRRGVTYLNTDLPTGAAFPDGSAAFITGSLEGNIAEFGRLAPGDGAAWEAQFNAFMANADLAFGVLFDRALVARRPLARTQGASAPRPPRAARVLREHARQLPRLGHGHVRVRGGSRRFSRPGCSIRASAPIRRPRGS